MIKNQDRKTLTDEIKKYAKAQGADLVGISPMSRLEKSKINLSINFSSCMLYCLEKAAEKLTSGAENSFTIADFQRHAALIFKKII